MTNYENMIKENAQEYYTTGNQKLSDNAFDALVEKVKKETPDSDVLRTGWGYTVNESGKIKHRYGHVGSLDKIHNEKELNNMFDSEKHTLYDVSAKLDGLSTVLYFEDGFLIKAVTRGDGEYGIDITEKIEYILGKKSINENIVNHVKIHDISFTGAVRGEIMMLPEDFKQYKSKHPEAKNHRNSAAGLINGYKITEDYKYLSFITYSVIGIGSDNYVFSEDRHFFGDINLVNAWLNENFEFTAPRIMVCYQNYKDFEDRLKNLKEEWSQNYYIDGVVISKTNLEITPTNEIVYNNAAFKFEDETAVTEVIDIEWNMSKNSEMIPVLQIEPVELEGTTVKRVTAFNAKFVQENKLGSGSMILICKRNQIIPYVMEVIEPAKTVNLPVTCEYCGEKLLWDENHVHLCCVNPCCSQKENEDLKAICLNLAPIDGLGWKTITKCFNDIFYQVHDYSFNTLKDILNADKIPGITGKGERCSFNTMLDKLKNNDITVSQFLLALNVPGLGKIGAKNWENSKNAIKLFNYVINNENSYNSNLELSNVIQDRNVVKSLIEDTKYNSRFKDYYEIFKSRIIFNNNNKQNIKKGVVCVTGTLSIKRAKFKEMLEQHGWTMVDKVYSNIDYLITNTPDSNTSKNKKADELKITKITEKDFIDNYLK